MESEEEKLSTEYADKIFPVETQGKLDYRLCKRDFKAGYQSGKQEGRDSMKREIVERLGNIIYRELAFLYQKDGYSIPCKDRETVRNKILTELENLS